MLYLSAICAHPDLDKQIADVSARIESEPTDARLYVQRGELHRIHRDWSSAKSDFDRARKLDPDLSSVDYVVGKMYLEAGRPKRAKRSLDRFLAREGEHAKGLVARGRAWAALGKPLDAARDLTRAIDAHGQASRPAPSVYLERAAALAEAGPQYLDEAVRGLDEGLERLGRPITLELRAIELEVRRERPDAALARLDGIAARSQRQETWLMRRGEILEQAGRPTEAREAYERALDAIDALPASRRATRAMHRLEEQARDALERLDGTADKHNG